MAEHARPRARRTSAAGGLAALLAAVLLAGCAAGGAGAGGDGSPAALAGTVHAPYEVPATELTDTSGEPYSLVADTDADLTLVFFGYTNCPDVCPAVTATMAAAMTRLSEEDRERVEVVYVTTDPARDTGPVLRSWLDRYDPSFVGLTGELGTVADVGEPLAVYVAQGAKLPSGGRDLEAHSSQITGVMADGTAPILWNRDVSPAELAGDVSALLGPDADALLEEGLS